MGAIPSFEKTDINALLIFFIMQKNEFNTEIQLFKKILSICKFINNFVKKQVLKVIFIKKFLIYFIAYNLYSKNLKEIMLLKFINIKKREANASLPQKSINSLIFMKSI